VFWHVGARQSLHTAESRWLLGLLLVSMLSHLALDFTNSYGVHPFWPFDNHWYYGDAVFIVEPWLWIVSLPALIAASRLRVARVLLLIVLLGGLLLAVRSSMVNRWAAVALIVVAVALSVLAPRVRPRTRTAVAVGCWVVVTLLFVTGTRVVRAGIVQTLRSRSNVEVLDVVVSPQPANPLCVTAIAVTRANGTYTVQYVKGSPWPAVMRAKRCHDERVGDMPVMTSYNRFGELEWGAEWSAPVSQIATYARESCPALATLRFMRVPMWRTLNDSTVIIGDARYGGASGGFSTMSVPRHSTTCPRGTPPWIPPRADLLR
jgi:inner membrane protein